MGYRIRNFFIIFILILAAFLLQYSVFVQIPYVNYAPNLLLIIVVAFAYGRGKNTGMLVGFFSGLFIDIFYSDVIGYNALIMLIIGLLCGALKKIFYSNNFTSQVFLTLGFDLAASLVYHFVWFTLRSHFVFGYNLLHVILPEFLFTVLAVLVLTKPLNFMIRKMYMYYDNDDQEYI